MRPEVLVVNGDSNTFGAELAEPERTSWAAVLGEHLSIPVVNLAAPGGSNQRMLRTTVELLPVVCERRGVAPHRVLFVGMWTFTNRREYWGAEPPRFVTSGERFTDGNWRAIGPWRVQSGHPPSIAWYRELQHDEADAEEFLCASVLLESWLEAFGCRFALTAAFQPVASSSLQEHAAYVAQMNDDHYVGGIAGLIDAPFRQLVRHLHDLGPGGHALEASHRYYSETHLLPWLQVSGLDR